MLYTLVSLVSLGFAASSYKSGFDFDAWDRVIDRHVHPGAFLGMRTNIVNYPAIKRDPDFQTVVKSLAEAKFDSLSKNESIALGCNAYNIAVANMLISDACTYDDKQQCIGPVYGVPGVPKGFTRTAIEFGGKNYSLNDIEGLFRPVPSAPLFDPKILPIQEDLRGHTCMVCGGTSCPDLHSYRPEKIEEQLDAAATSWMANPFKGMRIDRQNATVTFTRIFHWYKDEFDAQGGVVKAYNKYFQKEAREYLETANYKVEYFGYVWDANGPIPCDCEPAIDDMRVQWPGDHIGLA